jgi:rfaE bifunctional protein kinase chain/domain
MSRIPKPPGNFEPSELDRHVPQDKDEEDRGQGDRLFLNPTVPAFLAHLQHAHSASEILSYVEWLRGMRVLVVGEAILDEYVYCEAMGKSGKEPVLAMRYQSSDLQAGGTLAIANHTAEFSEHVHIACNLGEKETHEQFVRDHLKPSILPYFLYKTGSPTILKRRYVDTYTRAKLLGVYTINDEPLAPRDDEEFCQILEPLLEECHVVIVADYGHGLLTPRAVDLLCSKARFLAVNTQLNAANAGFHTISKYPRADYVCMHEGELRMDARDQRSDVADLVLDLAERIHCKAAMVTRGKTGTLLFDKNDGFFNCPALAESVVERIGAGDAVLAMSSLCVASGVPAAVTSFLSNLAGAQAVSVVGNSASISRIKLIASIESLLRRNMGRRARG